MEKKKPSSKVHPKSLSTILKKDIKSEMRQPNDIISIFLFGITSIFIFSSAYSLSTLDQRMPIEIFVIQIWIVLFFVMIFLMSKLLIKEKEMGTLGGLISAPVSSAKILISKTIFCFILLCFVEIIILIFGFFISVPLLENFGSINLIYYILLGIMLPTIDLSICGTIVSAFSMYAKNKSFILPILFFPIILPIINPIISINIKLLEGLSMIGVIYETLFLFFHIIVMTSALILVSDGLLSD